MLIPNDAKIYLYLPPTDMRKSIDTLSIMIVDLLKMNPASGHLFLFRNRSCNKIKALYYEPDCFTLWYRRLNKGRFVFPKNQEGNIEMSLEHFDWLLSSNKFTRLETIHAKHHHFC
ncbi:MAG: IS66 family insertion sequence element accessory protein TnpB [Candidatus Babeliales bacterium]